MASAFPTACGSHTTCWSHQDCRRNRSARSVRCWRGPHVTAPRVAGGDAGRVSQGMAASGAAQANAGESPWGQLVSLCDEFSTFPLLSASVVVGRNAACDGMCVWGDKVPSPVQLTVAVCAALAVVRAVYLRNPVISGDRMVVCGCWTGLRVVTVVLTCHRMPLRDRARFQQ